MLGGTPSPPNESRERAACAEWPLPIAGRIRYGNGEDAGVFVVHAIELYPVIETKARESQAPPLEQILRYGQRYTWTLGRKRRVGHHVEVERFDKLDAGILAATCTIRQPLDAFWITSLIRTISCDADTRIIALGDRPRKEVELTIRAANDSRIQDSVDLKRVARLGGHQYPKALQLEATHKPRLEQSALFCPIRMPTLLKISRQRLRKSFLIVAMCPARRNPCFCVNEEHLLESDTLASLDSRDNVLARIKQTLLAHGIDLPFATQHILFHDQTEETDGDRSRQREGWPAGEGKISTQRSIAQSLRALMQERTDRKQDARSSDDG